MYVWRKSFLAAVAILILVLIYVPFALLRPLPDIQPQLVALKTMPASSTAISWPDFGQAAIGSSTLGVLETHGPQTAVPSASVAKVITALAVLQKKPLKLDQQGPILTLTAQDVALYSEYVAKDGSVVPVVVGEQISEYQALQAVLLPSANNMADSLAIWAFGSLENYTTFTNQYVRQLGLTHTTVADASGFSPNTVTTSEDLVRLGLVAMQTPVLAQIVGQPQATITQAGVIKNVNILLGDHGIVGIKTGNTDAAGGVYLAAAKATAGGKPITIVTAVMGAPNLGRALNSSLPLIASVPSGFKMITPVHAGDKIATYSTAWGTNVTAVAQHDIQILQWQGQAVTLKAQLSKLPARTGAPQTVGKITVHNINTTETPVIIKSGSLSPSWTWRLLHPF